MAGAAATTRGRAKYQGDSRPTLEEQLAEVKKKENQQQATQARMAGPTVLNSSTQKNNQREDTYYSQRQKEDSRLRSRELSLAAAGSAGFGGANWNQGYDFRKGLGNVFRTIMNIPKPAVALGAAGAGVAVGYAARGTRNILSGANAATQNVKVSGLVPIFFFALAMHIYDIIYGFPRGAVSQFGFILGGYVAVTVLLIFWKGIPIREVAPYTIAQIALPWAIQAAMINPSFTFLLKWKEALVWVMILACPVIWGIFGHSEQSDVIMKWMNTGYVVFLCILLVPAGMYLAQDYYGTAGVTTVSSLNYGKEIMGKFWDNAKTVGAGIVNFIPNMIAGTQQQFSDEPPPGQVVGPVHLVGLKPVIPSEQVQKIMPGQSPKTKMQLFISSSDRTAYQFDTYCRIQTDKDNTLDSDSDGFVDISHWEKMNTERPLLASPRTIYCSLDPRSYDQHGTRNSVPVQFGAMYDVKNSGSYTTYFVEEKVDPATNTLTSKYQTPAEFFSKVINLNQAPQSTSTNSPCTMTMDNNGQPPPIYVRPDDPSYTVELSVGFEEKGAFGVTKIDSIKELSIHAPPGVTDLVCEDDPTMFEKKANSDGTFDFTLRQGYVLSGKKIRIDCRTTIDKSKLIWTNDYSISSFKVDSVCTMFNQATITADISGTGAGANGGYSRAWSAWPIEGPIVSCYGTESNPCIGNACNGQNPYGDSTTRWHEGVDIDGGSNEVKAVESGTVDRVCNGENSEGRSSQGCSDNAGYGRVVVIKHSDNFYTFYGHLDSVSPYIAPGYQIEAGKVIGIAGSTGVATGVHLHFGITTDGKLDHAENDAETEIRNPLCDLPNPSPGGNIWSCPNSPKKCAPRIPKLDVSPAGYPDASFIDAYENSFPVTGASGTLKSVTEQVANEKGINPALLTAMIQSESGFQPNCHDVGMSSLTGCAWPGSSCSSGCSNPKYCANDKAQLECTADFLLDPVGSGVCPSCSKCEGLTGNDKLTCTLCVYRYGANGFSGTTCDYSDKFMTQHLPKWLAYYQGSGKT